MNFDAYENLGPFLPGTAPVPAPEILLQNLFPQKEEGTGAGSGVVPVPGRKKASCQ